VQAKLVKGNIIEFRAETNMKRELKLCVHTISTNPKRKGLRVSAQATQTSAYLPRISRSEDLWTFCDKVNTSKPATYPRNEEVVYVIGGTLAVVTLPKPLQ